MADETERRLRTVNLNMLPVLRSILKHRNLTRVAEELNLTQSAVSNILKRLRDHFGDDLLVREGRKLHLSERAKRLVEPLEHAMTALDAVINQHRFDPKTAEHSFCIATADHVAATTLPLLATMLADEAPRITIQMVTASGRSTEQLLADAIDLVISPRQIVDPLFKTSQRLRTNCLTEALIDEPFVCIARGDDASFGETLTIEDYVARPHVGFALDVNFSASLEQAYLDHADFRQFNRIMTSEFTILPLIVSQSDCIALVPRSIARLASNALSLRVAPSPIPVPDLEMVAIWNRRRNDEAELTWLRTIMRRCLQRINAPYPPQRMRGFRPDTA